MTGPSVCPQPFPGGRPEQFPLPGFATPAATAADASADLRDAPTPQSLRALNWFGLLTALVALCGATAASPRPHAAQPVDHGNIGASEGPAWHPDGYLLFTGGGRITKRHAPSNA